MGKWKIETLEKRCEINLDYKWENDIFIINKIFRDIIKDSKSYICFGLFAAGYEQIWR